MKDKEILNFEVICESY